MYRIKKISIQNGTNSPALYERDVHKRVADMGQMEQYRRRIQLLATKRYNREISVIFTYVDMSKMYAYKDKLVRLTRRLNHRRNLRIR